MNAKGKIIKSLAGVRSETLDALGLDKKNDEVQIKELRSYDRIVFTNDKEITAAMFAIVDNLESLANRPLNNIVLSDGSRVTLAKKIAEIRERGLFETIIGESVQAEIHRASVGLVKEKPVAPVAPDVAEETL